MATIIFGATSTMAQTVGRLLCQQEKEFILIARHQSKLAEVATDLQARGAKVHTLYANLATVTHGTTAWQQAAQQLPSSPHHTVYLFQGVLPNEETTLENPEHLAEVFQVNTTVPTAIGALAAKWMAEQGGGTLVLISSVAGERGRYSNPVYAASKAALTQFASGLRARFRSRGVKIITIKPGMVRTAMTTHLKPGPLMASPDQVAQDIVRGVARHRPVIYTPCYWRLIMAIIRCIPENIFCRLRF